MEMTRFPRPIPGVWTIVSFPDFPSQNWEESQTIELPFSWGLAR